MRKIGRRLAEAREATGLSQAEAGEAYKSASGNTGSRGSVANWEREKVEIPAAYVAWLAEKTGFRLDYLMLGRGPRLPDDPVEPAVLQLEEIRRILEEGARPISPERHPAFRAAKRLPSATENNHRDSED